MNVGQPRSIEWAGRRVRSAIWKSPSAERLRASGDQLAGDRQADLRVHGGPDKAIYAYAVEDYRWWSEQLATELGPATFGENLTVAGLNLLDAVVGDEWRVGTAVLAVTEPRFPCFKLGMRMNDAAFVARFEDAGRFGTYLRIVEAGEIGAGDPIDVVPADAGGPTIGNVIEARRIRKARAAAAQAAQAAQARRIKGAS